MKTKMKPILCMILLFSCLFSTNIFANDTTVSIDICEIVVDCGKSGTFLVDGEKYSNSKSFFRSKGSNFEVEINPITNYRLTGITCDGMDGVIINSNKVTINDIQANVKIEGSFRKINSSNNNNNNNNNNNDDDEENVSGDNESISGDDETVSGDKGNVSGDNQGISGDNPCDGVHNCPSTAFSDVDTKEWYHEDLDYVIDKGLMNGVGNANFSPNTSTTRAMVVTILYRLENSPKTKAKNPFLDVEENTWYSDAILWASANNIVEGYGNEKFGPKDDITREQMVTILHRYGRYKKYNLYVEENNKILHFSDVHELSDWAYDAMEWACSRELIIGSDGKLMPTAKTKRSQIAAILHRFCENIVK